MIAQSEIRMSPKPWSMAESWAGTMSSLDRLHDAMKGTPYAQDVRNCETCVRLLFDLFEKACEAAGVSDPIALVEEIERLRNVPMAELTPAPRRSWLMRLLFGG